MNIFDLKAPTPHINATKGQIAKIVLMAGDPLRAKIFAYRYLTNVKLVSEVRNLYVFTGNYNNKKITVMGHGMGMASIGLYAYELYKFYDVSTIIRFGSAGSYNKNFKLFDVVIGDKAFSISNYGKGFGYNKKFINAPAIDLLNKIKWIINHEKDDMIKSKLHYSTIHSSDWFYAPKKFKSNDWFVDKNIDVVEMEAYALYIIAKYLNRQALTIVSISDIIGSDESITSGDREKNFFTMFELLNKILKVL